DRRRGPLSGPGPERGHPEKNRGKDGESGESCAHGAFRLSLRRQPRCARGSQRRFVLHGFSIPRKAPFRRGSRAGSDRIQSLGSYLPAWGGARTSPRAPKYSLAPPVGSGAGKGQEGGRPMNIDLSGRVGVVSGDSSALG